MKKTLRAIIAAMLAALMAFSGLTAFAAADTSDRLEWDFYGQSYYYDYAGELTEGDNTLSYDSSEYVYFTFDVQNAGYYKISYEYENIDAWIGIPGRYENGKAYDEADISSCNIENGHGIITRFEEGENLIILEYYYLVDTASLRIEFLGEEITEIKVESDLIYNYDIYTYEWDGENCFDIEADTEIVFSSGKTIKRYYISGTHENEITKGENILTAEYCGKEFEITVNVYYVDEYVESVTVSNIEDYLYTIEYYDSYDYFIPFGETVTVTFKDGTTDSIVYGDEDDIITLPNGREVWCNIDYDYDTNSLYVIVAGTYFAEYECETTPASLKENIDEMNYNNYNHIEMASYYLRRAVEVAFEDGIYGFMNGNAERAMVRIQWAFESLKCVLAEMAYLTAYLLS